MKKRLLSLFLALVVSAGVISATALTAEAVDLYPLSADSAAGESAPIDPFVLRRLMAMLTKEITPAVTASEGGTVTADRTSVRYKQDITYTITPDTGCAVADVIVDGKSVGAVSEYTFENVRRQHSMEVVFVKTGWNNPYSDVRESDWFYEDVAYVSENGIMSGMEEGGIFSPEANISRAMFVTLLWRMAGEPVVNYLMRFEDVPQGLWYSEAVRWAAAERFVFGYDGCFNPDDPITREELAVILYRYEQKKGGGFKGMWMFPLRYSDAADVSEWAYEAICWLTMKGIYVVREDGVLNPAEDASRADTAAFLHRYCTYRAEQAEP